MKTTGIKSWFCDVLAMRILLVILLAKTIIVALERVLLRINMKAFMLIVDTPAPCDPTAATLDHESTKPEPAMSGFDVAAAFLTELEARDAGVVAATREVLEGTSPGKHVVETWADRHDYVVAVPTKRENLQRVANVLAAIPDRIRGDIIDIVRSSPCCWMPDDDQES